MVKPTSSGNRSILSSRQHPYQSDSIRPLTADQKADRLCPPHVTNDPDLAAVAEAWPELPEAIKAGIVAMVKAASKTPRQKGPPTRSWAGAGQSQSRRLTETLIFDPDPQRSTLASHP